ncbi:SusC/RagA family TonB-linked outer membrane protein [Flavihumibacter stibioxidans]|uniref:SusC/RagA family TonB-linked outer membrane protein n=1 Tax=Flavihumibacter stibioxidans TaxID=1834163 RepID=A0ABR7M5H2_9BACT|nr:SusC/RagA family TonB-linked outer membrane protein [Flavihumibacter stibioxidans]MBC6490263.1 SusC/RagA family TonB-linked outer membrane protein [Flavihumibacter stibioxidans]
MKSACCKVGILLTCLLLSLSTWSQTRKVSGKVQAEEDNKPLAGVNVLVKGKSSGTQTNVNGEFSIEASETDVLLLSYAGYESLEIPVGNASNLDISMKANASNLSEVVVTGYGTQSRRNLSGSVSTVNKKMMESVPRTNAATLLQGAVAGVRVQQNTGQPGASPTIVLRGGTNFGGSGAPLFIVDGVIVPSLFGINTEDIESIDVLKDAASLAIYGARAGNGVVLVTTKKGKKGRTQVSYTFRHANNYIRRNDLELLSPADYIIWNRIGLANRYALAQADGNTSEMNNTRNQLTGGWGFAMNSNFTRPNGLYSTQLVTDNNRQLLNDRQWNLLVDKNPFIAGQMDSILYRATSQRQLEDLILQKSTLQEHYVNFSGASETSNFALGIGTVKDIGIAIGSNLKRYNLNFNGGLNVNKDLKITTNIAAYHYKGNPTYLAGDEGIFQRFAGIAPTVRLTHDSSGAILPGVDGSNMGNPLYLKDKFIRNEQEQRFSGSINLEYNILNGLKFVSSASGFMRFTNFQNFNKLFQSGTFGAVNSARSASFSNVRTYQYSYNAFLKYGKSINKHDIDLLGGAEYFDYKSYLESGSGIGSAADNLMYLANSIFTETRASSGVGSWNRFASLIGRVNYNYDNRYLLNLNLRYDGTSQLTNDDSRYTWFPGVSFGWNVHNEKFLYDSKIGNIVSTLKPRISWGQNGTLASGDFGTVQQFVNLGLYNGVGGYGQTSFVNPDLRWEKTTTFNVGVDIGFLKDRFTLIADYFVKNVYDKLQGIAIPSWTGFSSYQTNLATLQNRGIELELKAAVIRPKKANGFSLDASANIYHVKSFTKKLLDNGLERNRQGAIRVWDAKKGSYEWVAGLQEGYRVGLDEIWAPIFDGLYRTQEDLNEKSNLANLFLPTRDKKVKQLGDARWRDIDGNDTLDNRDYVFVGRTLPKVMGGFSLAANWKGFSLFTQFDYALGFVIMNQIRMRGLSQVQGSQNSSVDVKNTWTPENPNAAYPRYMWANYGRNFETGAGSGTPAANFFEKGDYLAMREITLSYQVPPAILTKYLNNRVRGFKAYVAGSNLLYISKYSGTFPEVGGYDNGKYPLPRVVTFGLNITL